MRMPNGYGSVVKLSGKRRNPYCVRLGCEYTTDGETLTETRKILGYYPTKREAIEALCAYHADPYDVGDKSTFADIFARWIADKKTSKTTIYSYTAAYNKCIALQNMPVKEIHLPQLQAVLDSYPKASRSTLNNIKVVMQGVFSYAMRCELIQKDPTKYLVIKEYATPTEKHKVFTAPEVSALWAMKPSKERDITLILLYTGWRVNELLQMPSENIDFKERTMRGGLKTKAGKDRIVPIHPRIFDLVKNNIPFDMTDTEIRAWMKQNTGHICHDTRHTFISELQSRGADHICIERLVGHSSNGITDKVYTHKDIHELRKAVELVEYKDITVTKCDMA